jgi:hypothetical protein
MTGTTQSTTAATLTEYKRDFDPGEPEMDGPRAVSHVKVGTTWQTDEGEMLDENPEDYHVECSCGEEFSSWGQATNHAENEH